MISQKSIFKLFIRKFISFQRQKNYTPRKIHIKQKNIDMICAEKVGKEKKKNKEITKIGVKVKYQYHIPNEITVTNT